MEWMQRAACRREDPELFFPVGDRGPLHDRAVVAAKRVCRRCQVRFECLQYALASNQTEGIFGGLTPAERRRLLALSPGLTRRAVSSVR